MASRKSEYKEKIIDNDTTPEFNKSVAKDLEDSIKTSQKEKIDEGKSDIDVKDLISKSYSPTINRLMDDLESLSAHPWTLSCTSKQQISIKKGDDMECVDWESKEAQNIMLRNLRRKKIKYNKVVGPAQIQQNCWFNVFFVLFFISKKGRKFFRHLRYLMITGKFPDNRDSEFAQSLRWPFFLLNYYIDSCIIGLEDPINFAETMNTNTLILEIGQILIKKYPEISESILPDKKGNPLQYYDTIINYLDTDKETMNTLVITDFIESNIKLIIENSSIIPQIFVVLSNMDEQNKTDIQVKYNITINSRKYEYSLDSACMLDTRRKHWVCFISGEDNEFVYDGISFSHLVPFKWKSLINTAAKFKLKEGGKKYSFLKCQTYYLYYRTK